MGTTTGPHADEARADEDTNLRGLADYCGIESEFIDAKGELRKASKDARQNLLSALGFDGDTEAAAAQTLDDLQSSEWREPLPPVRVAYGVPGPIDIEVTLPQGTEEIEWRVELEGGGELRGATALGQLPLIAERTLEGCALERRRLAFAGKIEPGYHRLTIKPTGAATLLVVTPGRCWLPTDAGHGTEKLWGVSAQLYLLRSERNWGIGDYSDLRELIELVRRWGGDIVGVNPLHAMFLDHPEHASPYAPAGRLLLNALNIAVDDIEGFSAATDVRPLMSSPEFCSVLAECQRARHVEYRRVAHLKIPVLRAVFEHCRSEAGERWKEFMAFRRTRGEILERAWLFLALRQHIATLDPDRADWHCWPAPYQDYRSDAVNVFAKEHADQVTWFAWLEWIADEQLSKAVKATSGMRIGLYRDLAVGADESGAEVWSNPEGFVRGVHVGAPPDLFNAQGQNWGLPALHPQVLRRSGYRAFIELLRANMRHAGALRIDHVMALQHLYLVPHGQSAADGAYVRYPLEDLIGILALESHRHRCLVIGEDLGSVPDGFRERMTQAGVLSYRVLIFERDKESGFLPPDSYPPLALAVFGNHDLPTLRGWWEEADIEIKERMHLFKTEAETSEARAERHRDRERLVAALRSERLLEGHQEPGFDQLLPAVHAWLGRSRAFLAMAQIDDLAAEADQVNVPSTSAEYPNWRRRLSMSLREIADNRGLREAVNALQRERSNNETTGAMPGGRAP